MVRVEDRVENPVQIERAEVQELPPVAPVKGAMEPASNTLLLKASQAIALAAARELKIVTAESCTAGRLSALLSDAPLAGQCLYGAYVVYAEAAKIALGVPDDVLAEHSAVSAEVTRLLAQHSRAEAGTDIAIAITGVLGPERDAANNPVGLVFIAASRKDRPSRVVKKDYGNLDRTAIISNTLDEALHLLLETIE